MIQVPELAPVSSLQVLAIALCWPARPVCSLYMAENPISSSHLICCVPGKFKFLEVELSVIYAIKLDKEGK